MKKVCHLSSVHFHQDTRILYKECSSLSKKYETHLIAVNDVPKIINNVKIHTFPKFKSRILRIIFAPILMFFKASRINAEIYHIHDPELIFCAIMLKLIFKKKIIYDVHEHIKKHFHSKPYKIPSLIMKLIILGYSFIENNLLDKFDFIVTATPLIKKEISPFNENTDDINNFPITQKNIPVSEQKEKSNSVCYVGSITKNRGVIEMVKCLDFDERIKLELAGNFVSKKLENKIRSMKSWNKVNYHGFCSRKKIYNIMNNSFAGLIVLKKINNYMNSFPNKMFEYMMAGIPIIASDFPVWRKILKDTDCAIYVDENNPEEIMNAITYLYENPDIAYKMGKVGREKVFSDYNWENEERKLFVIYDSLLGK